MIHSVIRGHDQVAALFAEVVPRYFSEDEVAVVTGGADISQKFA
ncbi:MAG: coniferyl-aldehyde dehydrogenase, partial [Halieaceae bacterium]